MRVRNVFSATVTRPMSGGGAEFKVLRYFGVEDLIGAHTCAKPLLGENDSMKKKEPRRSPGPASRHL